MDRWDETKKLMGKERIELGPHYTYVLKHFPRRLIFVLSHYKFAAKLIGDGKYVLEVGCSEGLGTVVLGESAKRVVGIDFDTDAIEEALHSFGSDKIEFRAQDFLAGQIDIFDAVVALDVIEHIYKEHEADFLMSVCANMSPYGVCIIGTPNMTADVYASATSKLGHVNLYTWDRLKSTMEKYFHQVLLFSANDEIIHTGFYPMAHYLIAVGICKKQA